MKIHFKSLIESLPDLDCLVKADFSALTLHMRASYVINVFWKDLRTSDHCRRGEAKDSIAVIWLRLLAMLRVCLC